MRVKWWSVGALLIAGGVIAAACSSGGSDGDAATAVTPAPEQSESNDADRAPREQAVEDEQAVAAEDGQAESDAAAADPEQQANPDDVKDAAAEEDAQPAEGLDQPSVSAAAFLPGDAAETPAGEPIIRDSNPAVPRWGLNWGTNWTIRIVEYKRVIDVSSDTTSGVESLLA